MKPENHTATLILAVLSEGPRHGYAIAREIERRSKNALSPGEGALYPALRALENDELVAGEWQVQPSGPARKVYTLTDQGHAELAKRTTAWDQYASAIAAVLGRKTPWTARLKTSRSSSIWTRSAPGLILCRPPSATKPARKCASTSSPWSSPSSKMDWAAMRLSPPPSTFIIRTA